ncbi:MAG: pilin [Luteibacter sp.]
MAEEQQYWLARGGEKLGPYRETVIRQLLAAGKIDWSILAWREGMAEWLPLSQVLTPAPGSTMPPPPPIDDGLPRMSASRGGAAYGNDSRDPYANAPTYATGYDEFASADPGSRRRLPEPPSLHWFLVALFTLLTLGIFGIVWPFIQASWVRKIDPSSKARTWLIVSLVCTVLSWVARFSLLGATGGVPVQPGHLPANYAGFMGVSLLLGIVNVVFFLMAVYSMAGSMRRVLPAYGIHPKIGGVTLFFFNMLYLQGQMTWVAHYKRTGSTEPAPPKLVFWLLWLLFPVPLAILAAIAIPAYQDYLIRSQVAEGMTVSAPAREAVAAYYGNHHALPADNAAAGLSPPESMQGRFVSGVRIDQGRVDVTYAMEATNRQLRDKTLVLTPFESSGGLAWRCNEGSDVDARRLPASCR